METRLTPNRRQRNRIATVGAAVAAVLVLAALLTAPAGAPADPTPEVATAAEPTATAPHHPVRALVAAQQATLDARVIALAGAVHERRVIEHAVAVAEAERHEAEHRAAEKARREAERREKARDDSTARTPTRAAAAAPTTGDCGGWEATIAALWPADQVARSCRIMMCESNGNPRAANPSGASGLFQIMPLWADDYQRVTGLPYYDGRFNGAANAQFARWLWGQSGWGPWVCRG